MLIPRTQALDAAHGGASRTPESRDARAWRVLPGYYWHRQFTRV